MNNLDIRLKLKENRLHHYEVAEKLGVSEYTFCVWLRKELPTEKKNAVLSAINELLKGVRNDR